MGFKQRLKRALDASDLTYAQVAEKLGVNQSRISEWLRDPKEDGASMPHAENLLRLPAILGVSGHWLLTGEGDMVAPPGQADEVLGKIRALVSPRSLASPDAQATLESGGAGGVPPAPGPKVPKKKRRPG